MPLNKILFYFLFKGFFAEYEVEKSEYQEAMKAYHNSTAYREWLKAKEKGD